MGSNNHTLIFERHQAGLRGYIAKHVPSREDCEDILQEVFYQLARLDTDESPVRQISGWLYSVARSKIVDRSRKKKEESLPYREQEDGELVLPALYEAVAGDGSTPEDEYLRALLWEELETSLLELPEEQRAVFELTEMEGFSFKEISESTGVPVNTLLSRKRYAVLHLRERLRELYDSIVGGK